MVLSKIDKVRKNFTEKMETEWKKVKTLLLINIIIKKIKEEDAAFDPTLYLMIKNNFLQTQTPGSCLLKKIS